MDFKLGKRVSSKFIERKLEWDLDNSIKKTSARLAKQAKIKKKKCDICGETKYNKECEFYGINYLQCKKCSLVYADKILEVDHNVLSYSNDENNESDTYVEKDFLKIREKIIEPKIKFIQKYNKGKKWLDVGSADGSIIKILKKKGYDCQGIEISANSRQFAKKNLNLELYPKPLEFFVKENNSKWNIVSFLGVLDLVSDPLKELKLAKQILKKNGIVVVCVPHYDSVSTLTQKLIKLPDRHLEPTTTIRQYNRKSLETAFKKTGFKPIAVWYYGMDSIEFIKILRKEIKFFKNSELDLFLKSISNELQQIFDKKMMGDQIFMIGKTM